ncbi:MAG: DNA translocase FtsK [Janthinobacterium lividum]
MTSFKEPNFSYTEATLRREVHTDNSHWELMYKAMLAQLMTYVDAAVARALVEHGIDESFTARAQAGARSAAQAYAAGASYAPEAPAPQRPATAEAHRYDPSMSGPFAGVILPPWLQPFTMPEQVRFTRTPDALLHRQATGYEAAPPLEDEAEPEITDGVPDWKKPVVLPANVRFNRTPDPKLSGIPNAHADETVGAQTFTGEAEPDELEGFVISLTDVQAERALAAAALSEADLLVHPVSEKDAPLPEWFATTLAAEALPSPDDHLAAAWLQAHGAEPAHKALRLSPELSLDAVMAAVEAVALDPAASIHPYGDSALWTTAVAPAVAAAAAAAVMVDAVAPPASLHPYGDMAFWIEGLADAAPTAPQVQEDEAAHPFGLAGLLLVEPPAPPVVVVAPDMAAEPQVAEILALPAPVRKVQRAPAITSAAAVDRVGVADPSGDAQRRAPSAPVEPASVTVEAETGPYGDSSLWLTLIGVEAPATSIADAGVAAAAKPIAEAEILDPDTPVPVGIASPADARAYAGPVRASIRRNLGGSHGLAPFELTNRVTSDPELYEDPPLDLLMLTPEPTGEVLSSGALEQNARLLEGVLEEFGIRGEIIDVRPGPVVTLYELEPAPGTKSSRVIGLADDIARSMSAVSARVAVVQGRNVIGIELPNQRRETVYLRELIAAEEFSETKHKLAIALGKTIGGESVIVDLARMPHLLVAGTTGSGKSVAINTMILSILYRLRPEECRLIMIDPKMLELSIYEGIPHLLTPVVTDPKKAVVALKWAVREMEDRYKKMAKVGVRNIDGFNARVVEAAEKGEVITRTIQTGFNRETGEPIFETEEMELSPLPYIVVVVDEMADLMMVAGKDIEGAIQRLAQMARAAGIHLIMATQRPSVDVITGTIKANFPTRISFQVTSKIDSRTILGEQGAEQLLGQGDMLHMAGGGRISRVHGPFVSDAEVEKVVAHLKMQGHPAYLDVVVAEEGADDGKAEASDDKPVFDRSAMGAAGSDDDSDLYDQAVKVVLRDKKCSTSYIQRRLAVGYNKAASLVERMEKEGIVGQANNAGKREILVYSRDLRFTESRDGED